MQFTHGPYTLTLDQDQAAAAPLVVCHFLEQPDQLRPQLTFPCHLAAITGLSEADLLPYPCPELGSRFAKAWGAAYYQTLCTELIPALQAQLPASPRGAPILAGYSLAGLFALWALAQADSTFSQVVSCSGSLWYPDILSALKLPAGVRPRSVYLSLGTKEQNKGPKRFRTVASCTEQAYHYYQALCPCCFTLNEGGHFDHVTERWAQGLNWTLKQYYHNGVAP